MYSSAKKVVCAVLHVESSLILTCLPHSPMQSITPVSKQNFNEVKENVDYLSEFFKI